MNNENIINAITKAIGYTENGGKPDLKNTKAGKTGELKSIFQFEPGTWKNYSKEVFGQEVPMNNDTETFVVKNKVANWYNKFKNQGLPDADVAKKIFSMWNAGEGEPNAYSGKFSDGSSSTGVNKKYGVKFDVPGYVNKAMGYLNEFSPNNTANVADATNNLTSIINDANKNSQQGNSGLLPNLMKNVGKGMLTSLI